MYCSNIGHKETQINVPVRKNIGATKNFTTAIVGQKRASINPDINWNQGLARVTVENSGNPTTL